MALRTNYRNKTVNSYIPQINGSDISVGNPENKTVGYNADFEEYGFWLNEIPHSGYAIIGTITGVSFAEVSSTPTAGNIRPPYGNRAKQYVKWVQCNSADNGKAVAITSYRGQGTGFTAEDINAQNTAINNAGGTTVKISSNDTTAGYLNGKLIAGNNVTLTEGFDGGNETLTIAATTGTNAGTTYANYYVNASTGNDSNDGLTSGTAKATIQAVINIIPFRIDKNVTINITAGTYNETVVIGDIMTGGYTITLDCAVSTVSTITASGGTQGTADNQGTVTGSSFDTWANKWIKGTSGANNGVRRLIDSNTTTSITIVDLWSGVIVNGDTFVIEDPSVTIDKILIKTGQKGIRVNKAKVNYTDNNTVNDFIGNFTEAIFTDCKFVFATGATITTKGEVTYECCYFEKTRLFGQSMSITVVSRCKLLNGASSRCIIVNQGVIRPTNGSVIDGASAIGYGVTANMNGAIDNYSSGGKSRIRNCTTQGAYAMYGGKIPSITNFICSGNTSNYGADATTFGYVG